MGRERETGNTQIDDVQCKITSGSRKCDEEKSGKVRVQGVVNSVVRGGLSEKTPEWSEGASRVDISVKNSPGRGHW